jgi:hypothetical protein
MPEIKENLDLLKKLQPLFKRVLGEYKFGDMVFSQLRSCIGYYSSMVLSGADEIYYFNTAFGHFTESDNVLRVPTFEELWGMVDWDKWSREILNDGTLELKSIVAPIRYIIDMPYTALLQALCSQEGI